MIYHTIKHHRQDSEESLQGIAAAGIRGNVR